VAADRFGYPSRVPSLFRRKSSDLVADAVDETSLTTEVDESAARATTKAYTPGKGRATPKRGPAGARKVAEPPPKNRREAYKRDRERMRAERAESRAGMMAGKDEYLLPRDKGPERRLVRDIVDSRRNIATWFFAGLFVVLIGSSTAWPVYVQVGANLLWIFLILALIVDSFLLTRRVRRLVLERFPKTDQKMSRLYFYAIMRAITFRRMRIPTAAVKLGDAI
jgi:DUF3043 family protein